jgi:hypothetical protein
MSEALAQQDGQSATPIAVPASEHDPTTNTLRPAEDSILTIRLIKSVLLDWLLHRLSDL